MQRKRILILGGEGFVGRNIATCLWDSHECHSAGIKKSLFAGRKDKFIKCDPYKEKIDNKYDVIIHLIDNDTKVGEFKKSEKKLIKNLGLNKKNHLILFSSAAVYSKPESEYGKRKLALERVYSDYCREYGIKLLILRLFNIYGPFQLPNRQGSFVATVIFNYLNGRATEINDFKAERDFIYSPDASKAVRWAIENNIEGTDDLATNRMTSIEDVINVIRKSAGKKMLLRDKKAKERKSPMAHSALIKNIKLVKFKEGVRKTLDFYKKNLSMLNQIIHG